MVAMNVNNFRFEKSLTVLKLQILRYFDKKKVQPIQI